MRVGASFPVAVAVAEPDLPGPERIRADSVQLSDFNTHGPHGLGGNIGYGHQHRLQLQQDHSIMTVSNNMALDVTMVLCGGTGNSKQYGPSSGTAFGHQHDHR